MPRLFTALEIPAAIRAGLRRLHLPLPGAKWIEMESYHLTLRFAGDIDNALARELAANLDGISAGIFELQLSGVGAFGGDDPKAVWAGVAPCPALDTLARAHERAARNAGLPPEKRPFKAHVTLARLRGSRPDAVARFLGRFAAYRSEPFIVERFVLMSSKPSSGGGPYVVEASFALSGAGYDHEDGEPAW